MQSALTIPDLYDNGTTTFSRGPGMGVGSYFALPLNLFLCNHIFLFGFLKSYRSYGFFMVSVTELDCGCWWWDE